MTFTATSGGDLRLPLRLSPRRNDGNDQAPSRTAYPSNRTHEAGGRRPRGFRASRERLSSKGDHTQRTPPDRPQERAPRRRRDPQVGVAYAHRRRDECANRLAERHGRRRGHRRHPASNRATSSGTASSNLIWATVRTFGEGSCRNRYPATVCQHHFAAAELRAIAESAVDEAGAEGPGDRGRVMGIVMPRVKGKADGRAVGAIVGELLGSVAPANRGPGRRSDRVTSSTLRIERRTRELGIIRVGIFIVILGALLGLLLVPNVPTFDELRIGDIAPRTSRAPGPDLRQRGTAETAAGPGRRRRAGRRRCQSRRSGCTGRAVRQPDAGDHGSAERRQRRAIPRSSNHSRLFPARTSRRRRSNTCSCSTTRSGARGLKRAAPSWGAPC